MREDLARVAKGLALLEVTDQIAQERHPDRRLFAMLVGALRALSDNDADPTLLAPSFFLKALVLEGARRRCSMRAPRAGKPTATSSWWPSIWSKGGRSVAAAVGAAR